MQGKITKVLNMRPAEILGMVEEAAGTRMFEERKDKAARTMAKKDKKVQEYAGLLADEITPKLDKTREEKRMFVRYQKATSELERAARVLRAHEHWDGTRRAAEKAREAREKQQQAEELVASKGELEQGIKAAEKEMKKIETQRDKELQKGGAFQKLERQVAELDKVVVKLRTQADIKKDTIKSEKEKLGKLAQERNGVRRSSHCSVDMVSHFFSLRNNWKPNAKNPRASPACSTKSSASTPTPPRTSPSPKSCCKRC